MSLTGDAPQKDDYAQKKYAQISREQWEDYKTRFRPYEDKLIDSINNPVLRDEEIGRAKKDTRMAYDTAERDALMRSGRYGGMSADERKVLDRKMGLAEATSVTAATNNTRQDIIDRDTQVQSGMVNVGRGVKGEATGGLATVAQMENERNNINQQIYAQNQANSIGTLGAVTGAAVMMS